MIYIIVLSTRDEVLNNNCSLISDELTPNILASCSYCSVEGIPLKAITAYSRSDILFCQIMNRYYIGLEHDTYSVFDNYLLPIPKQ